MTAEINYNKNPTVVGVAQDYIQTPQGIQNMVIRPVVHGLRLTQLALTAMCAPLNGPRELFKLADHMLYWVTYPTRIQNFDRAVRKLHDSFFQDSPQKIVSRISKLYISTLMMVGLVADGVKNLHVRGVVQLSAKASAVLSQVSFLGSLALLMLSAHEIKKQVKKLVRSKPWSPQFNLALIKLVNRVCVAVIAIFAIIAAFAASLISQWLVLGVGIGILVTSLTSHFYEKIHVPKDPKLVAL